MSGVFGGGGGGGQMTTVKKISDPVASPAPTPEAAPDTGMAAAMGESRAPVTRASTMLSTRRRAGEEPTVGTKKLLGQ
jgi:hypothetical protein